MRTLALTVLLALGACSQEDEPPPPQLSELYEAGAEGVTCVSPTAQAWDESHGWCTFADVQHEGATCAYAMVGFRRDHPDDPWYVSAVDVQGCR